MTTYAYSNNGLSFHAVDKTYSAQAGEILFNAIATPEQLSEVFPNYNTEINKELIVAQAQKALIDSNSIVMNCFENSITVPTDWVSYRSALRNVIKTGIGPLPTPPISIPNI